MSALTRWCLWLLVATAALSGTARAENRVAFVVGNDAYEHVPVLQKAVNDARAVRAMLESIGFKVIGGENLSRREMSRKLSEFDKLIEPGDTAFVFYAGHGVAVGGVNYILPTDMEALKPGEENLVSDEGFSVSNLSERIAREGAKTQVLVIDACRNNPFPAQGQRSIGGARGLAVVVAPPSGTLVLMSAGAGQTALDRLSDTDPDPNSIFTRKLLPLLSKPGLTHVELAKTLQSEVDALAETVGHKQTPAYYDEIKGLISLNPGEPGAAPQPAVGAPTPTTASPAPAPSDPDAAARTDYALAKAVGSREAWNLFLEKYRSGFYVGLAKAELAKLDGAAAASQPKPQAPPPPSDQMAALPPSGQRGSDFLFPYSDQRLISPAELRGMSKGQLRIARNEIYARRGRFFNTPDLQQYFGRFAWYRPNSWDPPLSPVEKKNVSAIEAAERGR